MTFRGESGTAPCVCAYTCVCAYVCVCVHACVRRACVCVRVGGWVGGCVCVCVTHSLIDRSGYSSQEPNLLCWYEGSLFVHHLHGGDPQGLLKVALGEELLVEEVGHLLGDFPALSVETEITGSHEYRAE